MVKEQLRSFHELDWHIKIYVFITLLCAVFGWGTLVSMFVRSFAYLPPLTPVGAVVDMFMLCIGLALFIIIFGIGMLYIVCKIVE